MADEQVTGGTEEQTPVENASQEQAQDAGGEEQPARASLLTDDDASEGQNEQGTGGASGSEGDGGELQISLPEGVDIDKAQLAAFSRAASEAKLTSEQASALAAWDVQRQAEAMEAQVKAIEARDDAWVKELQADPDFGGEKLKASVVAAKAAIRKFGGEPLVSELRSMGLGNHPALFRAFARAGALLAEDNSGGQRTGGEGRLSTKEVIKNFYGEIK